MPSYNRLTADNRIELYALNKASLTIVRFMRLTTLRRFWIGLKLSPSCP
jgi:hypothetical protein